MYNELALKNKYDLLLPALDERTKRLVASADALSMGRGGKLAVSKASGLSRVTLSAGIKELESGVSATVDKNSSKLRKAGGGRKKATIKAPHLAQAIEDLVSPHTMGDPMNPLRWTSKSFRKISSALRAQGYSISHETTGKILKDLGYSLQQNRKINEGGNHVDRDTQFIHINDTAKTYISNNEPVISVDCKKKELIGHYKNAGSEWGISKSPTAVKVYDFIDEQLGKAIPYGVYETNTNEGYVSVGIDHDTAAFAVATIGSWWNEIGKEKFSKSKRIYITADGGGSNSSRSRLWKAELQNFANATGLEIEVSHYPPGTSKWNKIEHRLFSYISINWRAKPLTSIQVVLDLIAGTSTTKGLKVNVKLDETVYQTGLKISNEEMSKINLIKNELNGLWNYVIKPNNVQVIS